MDSEARLAILEERTSNQKDQLGRVSSHLDSEQRVSQNHDKRIGSTENRLERIERRHDNYDKILFNSGEGILVKLDRIIQRDEQKEKEAKKFHLNFANILAIISIVANMVLGWLVTHA